jgi:hypothetical protein
VEALAAAWKLEGTLIAVSRGELVGEVKLDVSWMGFGELGMMVAAGRRGRGGDRVVAGSRPAQAPTPWPTLARRLNTAEAANQIVSVQQTNTATSSTQRDAIRTSPTTDLP